MNKKHKISLIIICLILLALSFEIIRDTFTKKGDFVGYVIAGNTVLDGEYIYSLPKINTWPPFFSIASVPVAIIDNFNIYLSRFLWLITSTIAMCFVANFTAKMVLNRRISFQLLNAPIRLTENSINITHWAILIPIVVIFRFILDNLSNIQINIFLLLAAISSIYYFSKGKDVLAAFILAFSISLKVYPIFLFLYFVVKREYKIVLFTLLFCLIFGLIPFFVFGIDQTLEYYSFWYNHNVAPFASVGHKNQSFFSMMRSLLTHDSPGLNQPLNEALYINIVNLSIEQVRLVSYAIVAVAGSFVVFLFRDKITKRDHLKSFLEYAFILTIIPILTPLSWKAYFIFLFPGYFLNYLFIYQYKNSLSKSLKKYLLANYYLSILLTIFSNEVFVGRYLSDILEAFSCITIGTILIAINLLIFYMNFDKFERNLTT